MKVKIKNSRGGQDRKATTILPIDWNVDQAMPVPVTCVAAKAGHVVEMFLYPAPQFRNAF